MTLPDNSILVDGQKPEKEIEQDRDQCTAKARCPCRLVGGHAIKVPVILAVVGCGFMMLGGIPLTVTMALGRRSSPASLIGMGFIGFGCMIVMLAVSWCLVTSGCPPFFTTPPCTSSDDSVSDDKSSISV